MSPFAITVRLGLSLLAAACALGLFLYFVIGQSDMAAGIACALGCAFISEAVAPPSDDVQALIGRLDESS